MMLHAFSKDGFVASNSHVKWEQQVNTLSICLQVEVRKAPHRPEAQRALAVLDNSKVHFEYSYSLQSWKF